MGVLIPFVKLNSCIWLRMLCLKCGEFDAAIDINAPTPDTCPTCGNHVREIESGFGQTRRELPFYSKPNPKMWGDTCLDGLEVEF